LAQPDDPCRAQVLGQRHSFQNDSVPLSANLSTSWRGNGANEQLPSGLRAKSATAPIVPVKLPVAWPNCPVPPVTSQVNCCVAVNRQLCGLTDPDRVPGVLTTCMVPLRKTRSSRLTPAESGGTSSTTRPTPLNTPLARTTLPMTVRVFVPGTATNTMVPL